MITRFSLTPVLSSGKDILEIQISIFIFSCSFDHPCNEIKFSRESLKAIQQDKNIYSHRSNCKPFVRFFSATFFPSAHRPIGQKCLLPPPLLRDQPYEYTESGTVFTASKSELVMQHRIFLNSSDEVCYQSVNTRLLRNLFSTK